MIGMISSSTSLPQSVQKTPGSEYKVRTLDTQLNTSEINTLKCKLQVQFTAKISAEKSLTQLSDNDYEDILTQLHLSLDSRYTTALNNAGFGKTSKINSSPSKSEGRSRIEALKTSLGINGSHLMKMNLSGADLSGEKLQKMFFSESNLSRANLSDTEISEVYLRKTNLTFADLSGAKLGRVVLWGADLRKANLTSTAITLALPEDWNPDLLDAHLNHLTNSRSLLTAINTIDDAYKDLKIDLMHQIVDSLEVHNTDTSSINKALLAEWNKNAIYAADEKITSFIERKCSSIKQV